MITSFTNAVPNIPKSKSFFQGDFDLCPIKRSKVNETGNTRYNPQLFSNNKLISNNLLKVYSGVSFGNKQNLLLNNLIRSVKESSVDDDYLIKLYEDATLSKKDITNIAISAPGYIPEKALNYFIRKGIPLTELDNNLIINRRRKNLDIPPLKETDTEFLENEDKIINHEYSKLDKIPKNRKIIILTGLSGAGKTTLINKYKQGEYYVADPDIIKTLFPQYEQAKRTNILHDVSKIILREKIIPKAISDGRNIITQTTSKSGYIKDLSKLAKENGYNVEILHMNIDRKTAMERTIQRFNDTGFFVDPYSIAIREPIMKSLLTDLKHSPYIDKIGIIDCKSISVETPINEIMNNIIYIQQK